MARSTIPHETLSGLVLRFAALAGAGEAGARYVTVEQIVTLAGRRSYGPLLVVIGAFSISPATIAPGMTWASAVLALLIAGQMVLGRARPWLPRWLLRLRVSEEAVQRGAAAMAPWARRMDHVLRPRLLVLTEAPFAIVAGAACLAAAMTTFPLGLIPFAPLAPGGAIMLIGLGLFARDGALMLAAFAMTFGAAGLAAFLFLAAR